ncbi:MAG: hypothetical protein ABIH40_02525 [Candidatus Omnitrophota bacterium]
MERIGVTAEKLMRDWQSRGNAQREASVWKGLKKNLTKQEQKHIKHYSLRNSQIILGIDYSPWFYTINLKKKRLLKGLNQKLRAGCAITEIFLRLEA